MGNTNNYLKNGKIPRSEIKFSHQFSQNMEGTMWIPIDAQTKLELIKKRTEELASYISLLKIDK